MFPITADVVILACEVMAALTLLALWFEDRKHIYMLWWSMAHVCLPLSALALQRVAGATHVSDADFALYSLFTSGQVIALVGGVLAYRFQRVRPSWAIAGGLGALLAVLMPGLLFGVPLGRVVAGAALVAAFGASAVLLWPIGAVERVVAGVFVVRAAVGTILSVMVILGYQDSPLFAYTLTFSAPMAIATALLLLVAAYRRSLVELRTQNAFLQLSHEVTAELQGVTDEESVAKRVLEALIQRQSWEHVGMFALNADGTAFRPLAGMRAAWCASPALNMPQSISLKEGLSGLAVKRRCVLVTNDLPNDERLSPTVREGARLTGMMTQVVVPLVHNDVVLGVLLLRHHARRFLPVSERRTLQSLGQMVGMSIANARNLRALAFRANHDSLTGLGNRAALHDDLLGALDSDYQAVLLFDLDHFKDVNDTLGHNVGDELLRGMAARLQKHLAERAMRLFRLGGDEFVVVHAITGGETEALDIARELAQLIAQPMLIGGMSLRTSASIGVAISPEHANDSHELLRCADVAMYHAKQGGLGIAPYQRAIDAQKRDHLTLLAAVSDALSEDQFELHYQPVTDLRSDRPIGCEALIRWRHPKRGLVSAAEFMPLIESSDLIREVTHRVITVAMKDAAAWQKQGLRIPIAINLSARNILDPDLPQFLLRSAERYGVAPTFVQLELTETLLIKDPVSAELVLRELAMAGFALVLDDFGTGYSSLEYLARFPFDTLKIDRTFVHHMLGETRNRTIVESTIALAHGLGLSVTAEGVEARAEADLLRTLGCDSAQGYLFARPMPAANFSEYWACPSMSTPSMSTP